MRLLLSFARGVHDEPAMLGRSTAAARFQLESSMLEEKAEGFRSPSTEGNA